jgi:diphthine synthase
MPFHEKGPADAVLRGIQGNLAEGLHTLVLLDLDNEQNKYMSVNQAILGLIEAGISPDTLVIGVARLGQSSAMIQAGHAADVASLDFGEPPHCLVFPGQLHFLEEDALKKLARCPTEVLKNRDLKPEIGRAHV